MIIDPNTNKPTQSKKLSDEQVFQALMATQIRTDGLNQQLFNAATLIEYMIEVLNSWPGPDGDYPLAIDPEEFQAFFKERVQEIDEQMKQVMSEGVDEIGSSVDLHQEDVDTSDE